MRHYGIKNVMLIAMFAWVLRFGLFGVGNPGFPGILMFVLSMIVYGVASISLIYRVHCSLIIVRSLHSALQHKVCLC